MGFPLLEETERGLSCPPCAKWLRSSTPTKRATFFWRSARSNFLRPLSRSAAEISKKRSANCLHTHNLGHTALHVYGTPQRLAVLISGLKEGSAAKTAERRGPALASAFDEKGHLTPQGQGFFKSLGLSAVKRDGLKKIKELSVKEGYLYATLKTRASPQRRFSRAFDQPHSQPRLPQKDALGRSRHHLSASAPLDHRALRLSSDPFCCRRHRLLAHFARPCPARAKEDHV